MEADKKPHAEVKPTVTPSKPVADSQGPSVTDKVRENPWILSTLVLGVVALILIISSFSGGITGGAVGVANKDVVTQKVMSFLNAQVGAGNVQYVKTSLKDGIYEIDVNYQGTQVPVYITADGVNLIQGLVPIDAALNASQNSTQPAGNGNAVVQVSVDDDPVKGNKAAPVTIVEFSDFECPYCGKFYKDTYNQIVTQYVNTGKANIVFRDFPLSDIHPYAEKAAEAAGCAYEQGKFWEYHNKLFENQADLTSTYQSKGISGVTDSLKQYAKDLKLNTAKFDECLDSGKRADEIKKDVADGSGYGVTGTPAFFINGKLIAGAYPFSEFQKIIDAELTKKSG
ncbi:DsbA family protein [Candidatus Pacearchaeota archaeon]|nr:DsbA family protein [Candidatus Pacearchaeota archaeon]